MAGEYESQHISDLQRENARLAVENNRLRRANRHLSIRVYAARVFCVMCIGLGAAGAGLWWKGYTDRVAMVSSLEVLSDSLSSLTVLYTDDTANPPFFPVFYTETGMYSWLLNRSYHRLRICHASTVGHHPPSMQKKGE